MKLIKLVTRVMLVCIALLPALSWAATREFNMTIEERMLHVAPGLDFKVFAYDGQVPGPLIHVKQGDDLIVHVTNNTTLPHTIHWHGTYQTNTWKMDGVPGVTQEPIMPGDTFTYKFKANRQGTLWYHCHVNVNEHAGIRGMWGPMIVDPKNPLPIEKTVTKDVIMMLSSWESQNAGKYGQGGTPSDVDNYWSINGKSFPMTQPIRVKKGDVVRVRFIGAGGSFHEMHLHGHDMLVIAKDGMPLASPYWADTVLVGPGERKDVIVKMNNPGRFIMHDHIDRHVTNDGKYPGGAITIVEYDGIPKEPWYVWKDKDATYDPNFFYSESMKQGYGIFTSPGFAGQPIEQTRRHER
ncbi:MAG: multicopper oxidase domain-containing protein [Gallionella sp.]